MTVFQSEGRWGRKDVHLRRRHALHGAGHAHGDFAGEEYGTGSSRDWAAKGTQLLGIKAVVARSFERIHRSNLVGMGVLPLQFKAGDSWESLGLTGTEIIDVVPDPALTPQSDAKLVVHRPDGNLPGGHRHPAHRHTHRSGTTTARAASAFVLRQLLQG